MAAYMLARAAVYARVPVVRERRFTPDSRAAMEAELDRRLHDVTGAHWSHGAISFTRGASMEAVDVANALRDELSQEFSWELWFRRDELVLF